MKPHNPNVLTHHTYSQVSQFFPEQKSYQSKSLSWFELWPKQDVIPPTESELAAAASPIGHYGQSCKIMSKNEKEK